MSAFMQFRPPPGPLALRGLSMTLGALDLAAAWLLCALMSVMVGVVAAQVFMRYGLNSSFDWADETSRLCFVWSIFIAIPLGVGARAHIGLDLLSGRLPAAWNNVISRLLALAGAALLGLVAWESAVLATDQWDELMASVPASAAWFNVPLVVCGVHGALHLLWQALAGAQASSPSLGHAE